MLTHVLRVVMCGNRNFGSVSVSKNRTEPNFICETVFYSFRCCIKPSVTTIFTKLKFQVSTHLGRSSWLMTDNRSIIMNNKQNFSELETSKLSLTSRQLGAQRRTSSILVLFAFSSYLTYMFISVSWSDLLLFHLLLFY